MTSLHSNRETDDTVAVVGNILDADSEVIGRMSLVVTMTFPDFGDATEQGPGLGLEQGSGRGITPRPGQGLGQGQGLVTSPPLSVLREGENPIAADLSPSTGLGQTQVEGQGQALEQEQGLDIRPTTLNKLTDMLPQDLEPTDPLDRPPRAGKGLARDGEAFQRKRQQLILDMQNLRNNQTPAGNAIMQQRQAMLMQAQQQQLLVQSQPPVQYDRTGYPINVPLVTKPNLHLVSEPSFAQAQGLARVVVGSMLEQVIASFVALETQSDFYRPSTGMNNPAGPGGGGGRALWMTGEDFDMGGLGDADMYLPAEGDEERAVGVALFGDEGDDDEDDGEDEVEESKEKGEQKGKEDMSVSLTIHALTGLLRSSSAPSHRSAGSDSQSRTSDSTTYGTALVEYITDALDHPLRGVPTPDHPGLHEKWREAPGRTSSGLGGAVQAHYDTDDDEEVVALTRGAQPRPLDDDTSPASPDGEEGETAASRRQELLDLQDLLDSPRTSPTRTRSPPRPGGGGGSPSSRGLGAAGGLGLDSAMGGSSMPAMYTRPLTFADDGVTDLRRRARASLPHPVTRSLAQHSHSPLPPQYWHLGVTFTFEHILEVDLANTLLGHMVMGYSQRTGEGGGIEGGSGAGSGVIGEEGMFNRSIDLDSAAAGTGGGDAHPTVGSGLGVEVALGPVDGGGGSVVSGGSSLLSKKTLMRLPLHIAVSAR